MAHVGDLTGGAGDDTFDIDAAVSGSLDGAGGEDRFELAATVRDVTVSGGAGDDTFMLESGRFGERWPWPVACKYGHPDGLCPRCDVGGDGWWWWVLWQPVVYGHGGPGGWHHGGYLQC